MVKVIIILLIVYFSWVYFQIIYVDFTDAKKYRQKQKEYPSPINKLKK